MGKLLLVALGIAVGTAVAVALSAREQLDGPQSAVPEPAPFVPEAPPTAWGAPAAPSAG